ncbi:MAG TPA: YoaK family protein [Vulgatibacter sp.]|nr:YoaK family protein [Vulgatibacter sp.]
MLSQEGKKRSFGANAGLAIVLAIVAGIVNAAGFFAVGTYTSHVTGSVSMVGDELAQGNTHLAGAAFVLVVSFIAGAMSASLFVEGAKLLGRARYAAALITEASILTAFTLVSALWDPRPSWVDLILTGSLCFAMGMQNALVTRISDAVVRTTHLTGMATDIGIELGHLIFWLREEGRSKGLLGRLVLLLGVWRNPEFGKLMLHLTIFSGFGVGAIVGPILYLRHSHLTMLLPGLLIVGLVVFDLVGTLRAKERAARLAAATSARTNDVALAEAAAEDLPREAMPATAEARPSARSLEGAAAGAAPGEPVCAEARGEVI